MPTTEQKVLLIDDEPLSIRVLTDALEQAGFPVETAEDGLAGLTLLQKAPDRYAVVVLDCVMPHMSGMELLQRLKETPVLDKIPIIMLTALDQHEDIVAAVQAGAFDYLTKPVDGKLLVDLVSQAIVQDSAAL